MARFLKTICLMAFVMALLPFAASAIVEPKTETTYPDQVTLESNGQTHKLVVTGAGLREKYFVKVDVYTIVSYVAEGTKLTGDQGLELLKADVPKQLQMDMRRGFGRQKLIDTFKDVIEDNYEDISHFATEFETFLSYFDRDAEENDRLVFTHIPEVGLSTSLNDVELGVIKGSVFSQALWTVWFGKEPGDDDLKEALLSAL